MGTYRVIGELQQWLPVVYGGEEAGECGVAYDRVAWGVSNNINDT